MKKVLYILAFGVISFLAFSQKNFASDSCTLIFYGDTLQIPVDSSLFATLDTPLSVNVITDFYDKLSVSSYPNLIKVLSDYKKKRQLSDWMFYQLIRKTAESISCKAAQYERYTLFKWFFLTKSGYDATLAMTGRELLFYARTEDNVYDIPYYMENGQQYVCLNIHDYGKIDFEKELLAKVDILVPEASHPFSYSVTNLPEFSPAAYKEKDIKFDYGNKEYHFRIMLNDEVQKAFTNYPIVDYSSYFNIPLSRQAYQSLVPPLKNVVKGMKQKKGVDYLMRFTRNAFLYENDQAYFGKEKRLSPEQTLFSEYSDCDDRAALFFYLVKEIYNLPMIVLLYPTHVTIGVRFDKPSGSTIVYKNNEYSVCEPTPQEDDLDIGEISRKLRGQPYEIAFEYNP